jgi:hypothetical protein
MKTLRGEKGRDSFKADAGDLVVCVQSNDPEYYIAGEVFEVYVSRWGRYFLKPTNTRTGYTQLSGGEGRWAPYGHIHEGVEDLL